MKVILLGLLGNIAVFLLFAFAYWNYNPLYWDFTGRVLCAFLISIITMITFTYFIIELTKDK